MNKKLVRTILVTRVINKITKEEKEVYGRYDPVTMERNNYQIIESFKRQYEMTDEIFARYGKMKGEIK